jgi:hypothetical protein
MYRVSTFQGHQLQVEAQWRSRVYRLITPAYLSHWKSDLRIQPLEQTSIITNYASNSTRQSRLSPPRTPPIYHSTLNSYAAQLPSMESLARPAELPRSCRVGPEIAPHPTGSRNGAR